MTEYKLHPLMKPKDAPIAVILFSFFLLGVTGLVDYGHYNLLPAEMVLEVAFFIAAALAFRGKISKYALSFSIIAVSYLIISYMLMEVFNRTSWYDFALAYKSYFYIPFLCIFADNATVSKDFFVKIYKFILLFMFVKYLYAKVLGLGEMGGLRPGLYGENNYELMFVLILYPIFHVYVQKKSLYFILLLLILVMSESRSAMLSLLLVYVCLYLRRLTFKTIFLLLFFGMVCGSAIYVFMERSSGLGIEGVDRYHFLIIFLREIKTWNFFNYLFGTFPLTPLSNISCSELSFYHTLFSHEGNGKCYSVILHSFDLRAVFDYGIIGFAFLIYFVRDSLRRVGIPLRIQLSIVGVILVNGLSVSALNSVFCVSALAICFAVGRQMNGEKIYNG